MRFLVIGLGSMGKRRIRNLFALGEKEIIGFDLSEERRKEAEEKHGIKTIADLVSLPVTEYDTLVISTPPDLHPIYLRKALAENKHVFVETGVTDDVVDEILAKQGDGMIRAPSCTFRHFAPVKRIKQLLDEGRIGKLLAYIYHLGQYLPDWHPWEDYRKVFFSKKETGACRELFSFELCWLTWVMGSPVEQVTGQIDHVSDLEMPADDVLMANVKHANNIRGNIAIEVVSRQPLRLLRIMGSEGVITWDWLANRIEVYDAKTKTSEVLTEGLGTNEGSLAVEEMYIEEMKSFLDAINGVSPYPYTWQEVRNNVGILKSLEAKRLS